MAAVRDTYWCSDVVYQGSCEGADTGGPYPACFSSSAEHILYAPKGWAAFYERVNALRHRGGGQKTPRVPMPLRRLPRPSLGAGPRLRTPERRRRRVEARRGGPEIEP